MEGYIGEVFTTVEDFTLLYPGDFLLPPGAYNNILNLVNIDGVKFCSKGFTAGTNLTEAAWPPIMTHYVAIAM